MMNWVTRGRRWSLVGLLLGALAHSAIAQIPGVESTKTPASPKQEQPADPLKRTTPRGTLVAFVEAVARDDLVSAARYLQITESDGRNTDALARDLKALIDRYFSQVLTSISDSPDGALNDGLPIDRERVGPLTVGERKIDIELVRVTNPQAGPVWLISSETLAQVPSLRSSITQTWVERTMPNTLTGRDLFGISLAYWVVLAVSLVSSFTLLMLISGGFIFLARRILSDARRQHALEAWYEAIRWPAITTLTLIIHLGSLLFLGFPLTFRIGYRRVMLVLAVIAFTWLLRRVLKLGFEHARSMVWGKERTSTQSLMLLGERLLQAFVMLVAVFTILTIVGVDTKTALAGVGIGGIALALGAKTTVENLLGGIFLLSDKAIAVGDMCRISNHLGWIEDITLRSVRLRTLDRSLVSVPTGVLAQAGIENFASREKILAQSILRLRYGTSVEQLRRILDGIRRLLDANSRIESGSRIRLVNFGERAVELELFAYVLTPDMLEFLAVREELLLEIATIVEEAGSGFAQPTQFIYRDDIPDADAPIRDSAARHDARLGG